jgi:hypothetical protein
VLVVFNYGEFMRKLDIVYAESGLCDFKRGTLCSLPRQVDSEGGDFSACCRNNPKKIEFSFRNLATHSRSYLLH